MAPFLQIRNFHVRQHKEKRRAIAKKVNPYKFNKERRAIAKFQMSLRCGWKNRIDSRYWALQWPMHAQFVCQQLFRGFRLPGNAALSSLFYSLSRVGSGLWLRCVGCYLWMFPGCFRSIFSTPSWNVLCSIPLPNWFSFLIGRALQCPLRWSCSIPTCLPREFLQSMILFAYIDVDWKKSFTLHLI